MLQDDSIHIKGTNYAYKVKGRGERLVLLHGFTASSKTWDFACEQLASRFQVMRIDLPGHGETTGNSVKTVEDFASDLAQIFQELKIKKAHILGYSMGGRAALTFALLYPELVDSLILESASPGIEGESERLARQEADEILAKRLEQDGIEEFVTYWENIPLFASQKTCQVM